MIDRRLVSRRILFRTFQYLLFYVAGVLLDVASVTRISALIRLSISISTLETVRALENTHPHRWRCTHGISYCRRYFRSWNQINDWLSVIPRTEGRRAIIHVGYFCFSIEPTWRIRWNSCKFPPPSWVTKTEQRGNRNGIHSRHWVNVIDTILVI